MQYRNWVEIDLNQIRANYHLLAKAAGVPVCPVVKADAYRHGAPEVARVLTQEGARIFAVSNTTEAAQLRHSGLQTPILILGDVLPFEYQTLVDLNLTPVIHSLGRLRDLDALGSPLNIHLKIDTGMGRLGCRAPLDEIAQALKQTKNLHFEGLTTHFASANDYETGQTESQLDHFESALSYLRSEHLDPALIHLASSGPVVFGRRRALGNLVRPGIALYGYGLDGSPSAPPVQAPVRPALAWYARILEIRDLPPGTPVGYNARWRAPRPSRIAVIAAGYADGIPQQLSCRGTALVQNKKVPYVGAVSMDLITLDVTDVPAAQRGETATLLGPGNDAQDLAQAAGVISYSILCAIANRPVRLYL